MHNDVDIKQCDFSLFIAGIHWKIQMIMLRKWHIKNDNWGCLNLLFGIVIIKKVKSVMGDMVEMVAWM
jgi:hypothetical protein